MEENSINSCDFLKYVISTRGGHCFLAPVVKNPSYVTRSKPSIATCYCKLPLTFTWRKWRKARTFWQLFVPPSRLKSECTRPQSRVDTNFCCCNCSDKPHVEKFSSNIEIIYDVAYIRPVDYQFTVHILSEYRIPEM